MDDYRIDSHKLIYHVDRVGQWLRDENIYPIYIEIAPAGGCNHRCIFCALDYLEYKLSFLDTEVLKKRLKEAAQCGVKSIMYAGEGEPLLHKDICEIIEATKKFGIDVAITTNGVLWDEEKLRTSLRYLSWLRVSLNAGTKENYSKVHRTKKSDFERVLENLRTAVRLKKEGHLPCTIGVQFLLIPQNFKEATTLAKILRNIEVDYLIIKPYSQHPLSITRIKVDYSRHLNLVEKLKSFETSDFKIVFRSHTIEKLKEEKFYRHCLGLPFWAYIDACGDVYACSAFLGKEEFCFGNIYKKGFKEIFQGKKRKSLVEWAATRLDTKVCREVCRLDEINRYLWELKYPPEHVNFI